MNIHITGENEQLKIWRDPRNRNWLAQSIMTRENREKTGKAMCSVKAVPIHCGRTNGFSLF